MNKAPPSTSLSRFLRAANPCRLPPQIPLLPDATARLAAVDLDWEHVRAVDILAVMRSFVPKGGSIQSVVVYPSGAATAGARPMLGTGRTPRCEKHRQCSWFISLAMIASGPCLLRLDLADYGLERMGQEAVLGPQGIFKSAQGVTGRKDGEQSKEAGGSGSDSGAPCSWALLPSSWACLLSRQPPPPCTTFRSCHPLALCCHACRGGRRGGSAPPADV